jgi:hypothetical protein
VPELSSTATVTAYGSSTSACSLASYASSPGGTIARVSCFDAATGLPADSPFTILVVGNQSLPMSTAFALSGGTAPVPVPPPATSWTSGQLPITVTRNASPGDYNVNLGTGNTLRSAKLVSAAQGQNNRCNVVQFISGGLQVRCYDRDGVASDQQFSVVQISGGRSGRRIGFAFANASSVASYTPITTTSFNSSGGPITATRTAVGRYAMNFTGLQKLPGHTEHVQVTGMGGELRTCNVVFWGNSADGLQVNVECRDRAGQLADARYEVLVIE